MQIITVAPVAKGVLRGTLTYFAKEQAEVGTIIMVPIRAREVPALVLAITEVSDAKSSIKSSDFTMRKIARIRPQRVWNQAFLEAAKETARYSVQELGETLLALTPKTILDAHLKNELEEISMPEIIPDQKNTCFAIQMTSKDRMESYRSFVREAFVRNESVFICFPTNSDVERAAQELKHGIEDHTLIFQSTTTKKRLIENWRRARDEKHAMLILGTPQHLGLPRFCKTIILEEEQSRSWNTLMHPRIDMRIFAETYAQRIGSTLIFGASLLRTETHKRIQEGAIGEFSRIASHIYQNITTEIIDPRIEEKNIKERTGRRAFQILSEKVRSVITDAQEKGGRIVLISVRKGLAPITACADCGTLVRCSACNTPLTIHKRASASLHEQNTRIFSCHSCGLIRAPEEGAHEACVACTSWRLEPLGIGIERIDEEVMSCFPNAPRFIFDGDRVRTQGQARKLITQFEKTSGAILIATPMAIPSLITVDHAAIISIDSWFAIPDFRMNERIFALILALREKTTKTLLVQTRTDDPTLITQALKGELSAFIEYELALRKAFSYPPYGTIIKITLRGKKAGLPEEMQRLKDFLSEYEPLIPPAMSHDARGLFRMHAIIKLAGHVWVDEILLTKLRTLPSQFTIEVNPDNLL